jgi:RNA recognition motif-containing protein
MEDSKSNALSQNKLFIGGLSPSTTQSSLISHFSSYGQVKDSVVMLDRGSGRSRCFGFVTMEDSISVERILSEDQQIDGKKADVKRAVPKETGLGSMNSSFRTKKIFVGGLPNDITEESFRLFFESFGEVEDSVVMIDRDTGKPRGFGFITFVDEDSTEKVLENFETNYINGKWIDCKKAVPKHGENSGFLGASQMELLCYAEEFVPSNWNFDAGNGN